MIDGYHAKQFVPPNASGESDRIGEDTRGQIESSPNTEKTPKAESQPRYELFCGRSVEIR
jgi:hypothetical protein